MVARTTATSKPSNPNVEAVTLNRVIPESEMKREIERQAGTR